MSWHICMCVSSSRALIDFTEDKMQPVWKGFVYSACFVVVIIVQAMLYHTTLYILLEVGIRIRATLIAAIFEKVRYGLICIIIEYIWLVELLEINFKLKFIDIVFWSQKLWFIFYSCKMMNLACYCVDVVLHNAHWSQCNQWLIYSVHCVLGASIISSCYIPVDARWEPV